jgi:hypothetical protein
MMMVGVIKVETVGVTMTRQATIIKMWIMMRLQNKSKEQ